MFSIVACGVIVLAVFEVLTVSGNLVCTSGAATIRVQTSCKQENDELVNAHTNNDALEICRKMAVMLMCAVSSLPRCYDYLEANFFNMYFHSPFSCELSREQIIELQILHNKGMGVATDNVSLSSSTTETSDHTATPISTHTDDVVNDATPIYEVISRRFLNGTEPEPSGGDTATNRSDAKMGTRDGHQGLLPGNGSSLSVLHKYPLVAFLLWSWALSWRLTS